MTRKFRLGLHPPVDGSIKLELKSFLNHEKLPTPPADFGHWGLVTDWGMLANDQYGCCAEAGACHQTMVWDAESKGPVSFTNAACLDNYTQITGFDVNNPDSDQGTQLSDLAKYWQNTGIVDANNVRHKIVAFMSIQPGNLNELWTATYLFGSVGLGFALPDSAMDQTKAGQVWDVVPGATIEGGHYVPCFGRKDGIAVGVSWGNPQGFTEAFFKEYNNQGFVGLSEEMLVNAKSIDGFDDAYLRKALTQL